MDHVITSSLAPEDTLEADILEVHSQEPAPTPLHMEYSGLIHTPSKKAH